MLSDVISIMETTLALTSVFQVPQDSSNPNQAQSDECQLSVMLFIDRVVKVTQYWFLR